MMNKNIYDIQRIRQRWTGFTVRLTMLMLGLTLMCTSCVREEVVSSTPDMLSFLPLSREMQQTRAEFAGGEFGVTVRHFPNDTQNGSTNKTLLNRDPISLNSSYNLWLPQTMVYWPVDGHALFTTAYAPTDKAPTTLPTNMNTPYKYTNYTHDITSNADLLYSNVVWSPISSSRGTGIPIQFHHALAQISFEVKADAANSPKVKREITLNSLKVAGIQPTGSVTISHNGNNVWSAGTSGIWNITKQNDYTQCSELLYEGPLVLSEQPVTVIDAHSVLPQALEQNTTATQAPQSLLLNYTVKSTFTKTADDGTITTETETKTHDQSMLLYTSTLPSWQMGKRISYTICINFNKPIEFEGSANNWGVDITLN